MSTRAVGVSQQTSSKLGPGLKSGLQRSFPNQGFAPVLTMFFFLITPSCVRSWPEPARPLGDLHSAGMHTAHHPPFGPEASAEDPHRSGVALEVYRWACLPVNLVAMVCGHHSFLAEELHITRHNVVGSSPGPFSCLQGEGLKVLSGRLL